VLGIQASPEYRTNLVQSLYKTFLHRSADSSGLTTFTNFLANGGTVEQAEEILTGSPEYFQTRGQGTSDGFLNALYQDAFKRSVDPSGHATFGQALAQGATPAQIAANIFTSIEFRQDLVQSFYQRFLQRTADLGGLSGWLSALQLGTTDEDVLAHIVGSAEYLTRV
jgi:hypothetical protein